MKIFQTLLLCTLALQFVHCYELKKMEEFSSTNVFNEAKDGGGQKSRKWTKILLASKRLSQYKTKHGKSGLLNGVKHGTDEKAISLLLKEMAKRRWIKYANICMSRFKSKPLCFSNGVTVFYVWQKMLVTKLRQDILGSLWDIIQAVGFRRFFQWISN